MTDAEAESSAVAQGNRGRRQGTHKPEPDIQVVNHPAGIDLPVLGHVGYRSLALYGGLAAAGVVGVVEWPVAVTAGVVYALARR